MESSVANSCGLLMSARCWGTAIGRQLQRELRKKHVNREFAFWCLQFFLLFLFFIKNFIILQYIIIFLYILCGIAEKKNNFIHKNEVEFYFTVLLSQLIMQLVVF